MKKIPALIACLFFWVALFVGLPDAQAQKKEEPPDNPPQKDLFEKKCQKCHTLERIEAAHLTRDKAKEIVEKMRKKEGADISQADAEFIYQYLGEYFVIPPSAPVAPAPFK
jgi:hypothetical protein